MKIQLAALLLSAAFVLLTGCGDRKSSAFELDVSLISLIAGPKEYDGRDVRVIGYGLIEMESTVLFFSEDDYRFGNTSNSIWLDIDINSAEFSERRRGWMLVEGTFSVDHRGHMGLFPGSIIGIERVEFREPL